MIHTISGIAFSRIGMMIANMCDISFNQKLIYAFMFAVTIHVFWELFEFGCDEIIGTNMQRKQSIVADTMTDFVANILGAILSCFYYLL